MTTKVPPKNSSDFGKCAVDRATGASMVEYSLLLALIAMVALAVLTSLGEDVSDKFSEVASLVSEAGT